MERYMSELKSMLWKDYREQYPDATDAELTGFITGMTWLEEALSEKNESQYPLNDFVPESARLKYLSRQVEQCLTVLDENAKLKDTVKGLRNRIENMEHCSKQEIAQLRQNKEFNKVKEEAERLRMFQDKYYCLLVEKYREKRK